MPTRSASPPASTSNTGRPGCSAAASSGGDGAAMLAIRSLIFNIAFVLWTSLVVLGGLVLLPLPWRWMHRLGRFWCRGSLFLLRAIVGLTHRIEGSGNLLGEPA